jgi:hypothetical protein
MTMTSRTALLVIFVLGCGGALLGVSCDSGGDFDTNRQPADAIVTIGDAGEQEVNTGCPEGEPKIGETCPPGFFESSTCTYQVGTCHGPTGQVYPDYLNYCCVKGLWQACGGMSQCDGYDGGAAPPPDAAPSDGGDGGPG